MKEENTSLRLQEIMEKRGLRQVDILEMARPFCEKYDVKLNKSDLSQYISGKVEPGQDKLFVLANALNVNEVWLMGHPVSPERDHPIALRNDYSNIFREHLASELDLARSYLTGDEPAMADYYELEHLLESPGPLMLDDACRAADMIGQTMGYLLGEDDVDSGNQAETKKSPSSEDSEPRDEFDHEVISLFHSLRPEQRGLALSILKTVVAESQGKPVDVQASTDEPAPKAERQRSPK